MKRNSYLKIMLALTLSFAFIFNLTSMTFNKINLNKISEILLEKMDDNTERIPVSIWFTAPDISKSQKAAQSAMVSLSQNAESTNSVAASKDASNRIKLDYRSAVSQLYTINNSNLTKKLLNNQNIIYSSRYAPMVIANLTNQEIIDLSGSDDVLSLDHYDTPQLDILDSDSILENPLRDHHIISEASSANIGTINIGVYDRGIPNAAETAGLNVIAQWGNIEDENPYATHAGMVTDILREFLPNANYYFTGNVQGVEPFDHIEWLLDQGVDIINMSFLTGSDAANTYGNIAKWFDHVAYYHYVLILISAGNDHAIVSSPAMAYNTLTVGSMIQSGSNYTLANFSGYYTGYEYASKPDICAIGPEGTSAAAPRVTAIAALLMAQNPSLTYSPELIKAILAASVDTNTPHHYVPTQRSTSGTNYMQAGAGLLNASNAFDVIENGQTFNTTFNASKTSQTISFSISNADIGSVVRVALAYTIPVELQSNHENWGVNLYGIPNLDLKVSAPYSSTPSWISSSQNNNNIEIVEFIPQIAGTYTIQIVTISGTTTSSNIDLGVAWSIQ